VRALIIGGGAIGQFLAAKLAQGGHEPIILARAAGADAINARGVTLRRASAAVTVRVRAAADPKNDALRDAFEIVIVAVKSFATAEAVNSIRGVPGSAQSTILTVQNGIGNEEVLRDAFGADRIVAGALTVAVDRLDDTTVAPTLKGGLSVAPLGAFPHNWMLLLWESSDLPVRAVAHWQSLKWSKLCINILGNAVCAALDWTPAQVYADPTAFRIERACLLETIAVMDELRLAPIDLIGFPIGLLVRAARTLPAPLLRGVLTNRVARGRGEKLPSLLLDLRAGKKQTEIDALNGAVAQRAAAAGCQAATNAKVASAVSGIASGAVSWADYRGQPSKLRPQS
jgi:2-dehydropantoate 2-reductase